MLTTQARPLRKSKLEFAGAGREVPGARRVGGVPATRRGTSRSRLVWLTIAESFSGFQRHVKLGRGDNRDGFRLVTTVGGSRLGVAGGGASRTGQAAGRQLLQEGFHFLDF